MVVQESEKNKALENPGADAFMSKFGGAKAGLPFFAFLDEKGEMLANTMRPADGSDKGGNIGHPFEPKEVDWFLVMVKKAAPSITADELKTLESRLRAQKK